MTPAGVMRPMAFASSSVNQRLPLGPMAMNSGSLGGVGVDELGDHAVGGQTADAIRVGSVNQMLPKGPVVIPVAPTLLFVDTVISVSSWTGSRPADTTLPMTVSSANHRPTRVRPAIRTPMEQARREV